MPSVEARIILLESEINKHKSEIERKRLELRHVQNEVAYHNAMVARLELHLKEEIANQ